MQRKNFSLYLLVYLTTLSKGCWKTNIASRSNENISEAWPRQVFLIFVNSRTGKIATGSLQLILRFLVYGFVSLISTVASQAQNSVKRLDSLFAALHQEHKFDGNVLIADRGKVVYQGSFGFANRETNLQNTAASRFHLASTSKLFTAVAVMQLVEKGRIRLSDPVVKYLPGFPYQNITIRHLLTHTSGLPDFQIFEPLYKENPNRIYTYTDLIPALKAYGKVLFEPGEKWSYSSPGTALLAAVVAKVTRTNFADYVKKRIWDVAGMKHTYINSLSAVVKDSLRVSNYARSGIFSDSVRIADSIPRHREFAQLSGALIGPGLIVSDTHDLLLFDQALASAKLLKQTTMNDMYNPVKLNSGEYARPEPFLGDTRFGLGWFLYNDERGNKMALHTGKQGGIITVFVRDLTGKRTYILLNNSESPELNNTTLNAMRILDNRPLRVAKASSAYTYAKDITARDIDYALSRFIQNRADTAHYYLNHFEMADVCYQLIATGRPEQGIETMRLLTQVFPDNWYPYFSYGKELAARGKKEEAVINLNKALFLSPGNKEVLQVLEGLK